MLKPEHWKQICVHLQPHAERNDGVLGAVLGAAMGAAGAAAQGREGELKATTVVAAALLGLAYGAVDVSRLGVNFPGRRRG